MRPHPSRHGGKAGSRLIKLLTLWTLILGAGGGLAAAGLIAVNQPADAVTLCRQGRLKSSTLVLIDTTDPLTEIQARRLRAAVEAERDELPRGGRLTLLLLNPDDAGAPVELASLCNPGRAADADPLFHTTSRIDKDWQEGFAAPLDAALAKAGATGAAAASPIIATIAAALTRPDFDRRVPARRLLIVSDLLEYTKGGYSQLAGGNLWKAYAASALARDMPLDLHGVSVAVDYLARPRFAAVQGDTHRRFWVRLFTEAGAPQVQFIGLRSPAPEITDSGGEETARLSRNKGRTQ